ncbi:MAG TPA: branched-chain amino acid ABC transporter permease [Gemmataceae bacterium]|jgi:branched-chain amino acid transport system permease protein|nr:branched-chain amino acid ABC transporter permease [Gemmataceae bacterium]
MKTILQRVPWLWMMFVLAVAYPILPGLDKEVFEITGQPVGRVIATIFISAILALGLNVVVGNAGLLHLGIGAFFGFGAYLTGIIMVREYPFQREIAPVAAFFLCVAVSTIGSALLAVILSGPVLRLRGDYFALVTLGFGEVVRFTLRNLEEVTAGTKGLKPIPSPWTMDVDFAWNYRGYYFLTLTFLTIVILLLRNLERSAIGRAWVALREDELAAASMGLNVARLKLGAIALGAGLAGLAGCLFAYVLRNTSDPDQYGFNISIMTLCCLILGGVGNRTGVIVGVVLVFGFDNLLSPIMDSYLQRQLFAVADPAGDVRVFGGRIGNTGSPYLNFSGWRLAVFGLALIFVMRFRPSGLIPARRGSTKES